jgi:beta-glucanase (GH16 family)
MPNRRGRAFIVALVLASAAGCGRGGKNLVPGVDTAGLHPPSNIPAGLNVELVWSDEFDGKSINPDKWDHITGPRRDGFWVKEDATLDGRGHLVLRTKKDGERFTSGAIWTRSKYLSSFGYYEIRCRLPEREGHWPAFWLQSPSYGSKIGDLAAAGAEIDIMEYPWRDGTINHAIHWDGYGPDHKTFVTKSKLGRPSGWHTFGLLWTEQAYVFYVDGREVARTTEGVSKRSEYIEVTDEIGTWGGDIKRAALPDYCYVDYVRVYRIKK